MYVKNYSLKTLFTNNFLASILSLFLIVTLLGCSQNSNTNNIDLPSDSTITESIHTQLEKAIAVPEDSIQINTDKGIVQLTGSTANLLAKQKATRIAEEITGVLSVVNNLKVTANRPDKAVQQDVSRALATDPATEAWEIATDVNNGLVTLTGNVDSWQEKQLAGTITSGVKGVTGINNNILVSVNDAREDANIKAEIEKTLMFDSRIRDNLIKVAVQQDTVQLSGSVGSATEKRLAVQEAHVDGVDAVQAQQLEVHPEYNSKQFINEMTSSLSPAQIEKAIHRSLTYDPRVPADEIEVTVKDTTAILNGSVQNLSAKLAAQEDARNTAGINKVENNITVERKVVVTPDIPTTDEAIKSRIKNSIIRDPYVEEAVLSITVNEGIVEISGDVNSEFEKEQIQQIASNVKGVLAVNNNLKIQPQSGETTYH